MSKTPTLLWFRQDLRLADHPALEAAIRRGAVVIPVFIWAPDEEGDWTPGAATRWWLHQSLRSLDHSLRSLGSQLTVRRGRSLEVLEELIDSTGASAVFWGRRYEPASIERDKRIKEALRSVGIEAESFNTSLLCEPWIPKTKTGGPFQVFTPFWRHCRSQPDPADPISTPSALPAFSNGPPSLSIGELALEPSIPWAEGMRSAWTPGEAGAQRALTEFLSQTVIHYSENRNFPSQRGTSRLSPHLHFGEISPRQVWNAARDAAARLGVADGTWQGWQFLTELGWREFAFHLMFHFPHTPRLPLRHQFARFPWRVDADALALWQKGQTGYPMVDAGMRELWATGWMHNRVRMVAASFLVKHLLISWESGATWFWDTLVDADLASNTLGWQWTAGCGADAAPFFRIFNPVSQGEKFDPDGDYVRRWLPELSRMPAEWIHQPWAAPKEVLREANVTIGKSYPHPIVDHAVARKRALDALKAL